MTRRLYHTDAYQAEFEAKVSRVDEVDGRTRVLLDRTAFYATSGGQPFDSGTLDGARVVDVVEDEQGELWHVLDRSSSIPLLGTRVAGRIDWERRFDHMQQHTGQHILSAAFDRLHQAGTGGFHLGSVSSTIDLNRELSADAIVSAEAEANRIVWENRPVHVKFVSADEATTLPLRKEPTRAGDLRLIEVEDFDLSACGGTHVTRSGAIGVIAIAGSERFRAGSRLEFLCGARALRYLQASRDILGRVARQLSVPPDDLSAALDRLQAEGKDLRRVVRTLQERLNAYEADALAARGVQATFGVLVVEEADADAAGLKRLAVAISTRPGYVAVLFAGAEGRLVAIACAASLEIDAAALLRQLTTRFGGRGGGRRDFAQGGGLSGSAGEMRAFARELMGC